MPPQGIDMGLIREAMSRRGGLQPGQGIGVANEGNEPNAPVQGAPQPQQPNPSQIPNVSPGQVRGAAAKSDTPLFDEETRRLGKALMKKLMDAI